MGYGIGGHGDFPDSKVDWKSVKPWQNEDPYEMHKIAKKYQNSFNTWMENGNFEIDYVRIYSN